MKRLILSLLATLFMVAGGFHPTQAAPVDAVSPCTAVHTSLEALRAEYHDLALHAGNPELARFYASATSPWSLAALTLWHTGTLEGEGPPIVNLRQSLPLSDVLEIVNSANFSGSLMRMVAVPMLTSLSSGGFLESLNLETPSEAVVGLVRETLVPGSRAARLSGVVVQDLNFGCSGMLITLYSTN